MEVPLLVVVLVAVVAILVASFYLTKSTGTKTARVTELWVHPIKSCSGISVQEWPVTLRGLLYDRVFMLVTEHNNRFVTQRKNSKMALIRVGLDLAERCMTVDAPGMDTLILSLEEPRVGESREAIVWGSTVSTTDVGDEAATWFNKFLGDDSLRLVRMCESSVRRCDEFAPKSQCALSDGYPFLLCSEESLRDLNDKLEEPITMRRFRPNIVVSGAAPWAEDTWDRITIGSFSMTMCKPCARCKIPTIDPLTGEFGPQPTRAMKEFRTGQLLGLKDASFNSELFFGVNLAHTSTGLLRVGDSLSVKSINNFGPWS